jgi:hypothetical protein
MFKIVAPAEYESQVCGLCGNFDGVRPDRFTGFNNQLESNCPAKTVAMEFGDQVW